jgi:hypothetical protein
VGTKIFFASHNEARVGVVDTRTNAFSLITTPGITPTSLGIYLHIVHAHLPDESERRGDLRKIFVRVTFARKAVLGRFGSLFLFHPHNYIWFPTSQPRLAQKNQNRLPEHHLCANPCFHEISPLGCVRCGCWVYPAGPNDPTCSPSTTDDLHPCVRLCCRCVFHMVV